MDKNADFLDDVDEYQDGCDSDYTIDPDDDEVAELRALFPDGVADETKAAAWREIAGAGNA